jgi:hypothetical protein
MYDVADVLTKIDTNVGVVVVLLLFGWIGGFVQIVEALRLGFRERVAGQPIATTMIMLAHDATFSIGYDHWFHEVDHICFKLFWVGMVAANAIELVLLYHWVRFRDTTRGTQPPEWAVWTIVGVFGVFAFALWWWIQSLVGDPLDLMGLTVVQVGAVVFGVPMLLGRGTARGQSRVFAWATVLGPGSLGFLFIPYLSPKFAAHPAFYVLAGTTTVCAVAFLLLYEHLRRADARQPAKAAPIPVA